MRFGMPTLIELKSPGECAALCRELGLSFVELNMNLPEYQADRLDIGSLQKIAREYGVSYTIHLDENLNPCDFNGRVAAAYTETALAAIEAAKALSVPVLVMHMNSGVWFTLPDKKVFLFEEYKGEYLRRLAAFRDACEAAVGKSGVRLCVENCGDFGRGGFLAEGLDLLLASDAFGLCLDVGHNAAAGYTDETFVLARAGRLGHMHLHDARGRQNHLPLGEGEIDLGRYLALAGERDCRVVLEVKTVEGLRASAAWLGERARL